ncbi:MAG: DUF3333 domain-containing protein, partial [Tabrizicola sp.]
MTDVTAGGLARPKHSILTASTEMKRRNAAEARFKVYGLVAIAISLITLAIMLFTIFRDGVSAFHQATLTYPVELSAETLDPKGNRSRDEMAKVTTVGYQKVLSNALLAELAQRGISQDGVSDKDIGALISKDAAGQLRAQVLANPDMIGTTITGDILAAGRVDGFLKGRVTFETAER